MRFSSKLLMFVSVAAAMVWIPAGCAKKAERPPEDKVALVKASERSAHFAAVTRELELGGMIYGYVDIDGDMTRLASTLQGLAKQATATQPLAQAFVPADFAPFFADLGLTDLKAIGFSSVAAEGGGFRNRVFLYMPAGRHGLLAGLGGAPAPFDIARLAPADADLVYETEFDAPAAFAAIRAVVARAFGEPMAKLLDAKLSQPEPGAPFPLKDLLDAAKGRFSLVLRIDDTRTFPAGPTGVTLPAFDLALRQEHGGAKLAQALAQAPASLVAREERAGGVTAFVSKTEVPLIGWRPEVLIEGDSVLIVSRAGFLASDQAKLADDPAFRSALAALGEAGNGLTYVGPRLGVRVHRVADLNQNLPAEQALVMQRVLAMFPEPGAALVSVRQNLPDGVLFRSQWSSSLKSNLVMANPGVIAGTGLMAAMAVPAFQKVRASSQEKAVLNNLRQLAAASDQYFLETGRIACTYADLDRGKYLRDLRPVAGENYTGMIFRQGEPLRARLADGRVVEYAR